MSSTKKKLVMVFGTFDYLHAGHENLFHQAKELGDEVIAIIARDKTVKTIKGFLPDHDEKTRLQNLKNTGWSTRAVLGNHKDKTTVIKDYRPNVIALGYDQFAFTYRLQKTLMDLKLDATIVRLTPYKPNLYKSSILKRAKKSLNPPHEQKTKSPQPLET